MFIKIHVIEMSVLFLRKILLRVQKRYLIAMFFEEKNSLVPAGGSNSMVPYSYSALEATYEILLIIFYYSFTISLMITNILVFV